MTKKGETWMINEILLKIEENTKGNIIVITTNVKDYEIMVESDLSFHHDAFVESISEGYKEQYGSKILNVQCDGAFLNITTCNGYITIEGRSDDSSWYDCYWNL